MFKALILVAGAVAIAAVPSSQRHEYIVANDQQWLMSDTCEIGWDADSCALELANKRLLRNGPVRVISD